MIIPYKYEVIFPDGMVESYLANTITENLYSQVDDEGRSFTILSESITRMKWHSQLMDLMMRDNALILPRGGNFLFHGRMGRRLTYPSVK